MALAYYARARFILNLLPLLRRAPSLRRVVTVLAACHEGPIYADDFQGRKVPLSGMRGHNVSMTDLMLEHMSSLAPEVSFVHDYPGPVKSGFGRETNGIMMKVVISIFKIIGPLVYVPTWESGERHLFFATSARYPARSATGAAGVPVQGGVAVSGGTTGEVGSEVYAVNWDGKSAGPKSLQVLAKMREEGTVQRLWEHTMAEFKRVTGMESLGEDG